MNTLKAFSAHYYMICGANVILSEDADPHKAERHSDTKKPQNVSCHRCPCVRGGFSQQNVFMRVCIRVYDSCFVRVLAAPKMHLETILSLVEGVLQSINIIVHVVRVHLLGRWIWRYPKLMRPSAKREKISELVRSYTLQVSSSYPKVNGLLLIGVRVC